MKSKQQNRPQAVGYDSLGPFNFPLPHEILKEEIAAQTQDLPELAISVLMLDNHENASHRDLRILYSGEFEYSAQLEFRRRDVKVRYKIDCQNKEILIDEIPPRETISVVFFNPDAGFSIDYVLIGDTEITTPMRKLAAAKRDPKLYWYGKIANYVMVISVVAMLYTGYAVWKQNQDQRVISSISGNLEGCTPTVIYESDEHQSDLNRRFLKLNYPFDRLVLSLNKVSSLQELDAKKTVIFCEPSK
ncbi:hypothetical protein [Paraburkholderia unamae]|uniref:hypothetical protein n=1 Tax=Paraburkholderia unamae TaxID=219649 RepID=UPI0010582EE6|nr:hypothetical protein [Paraburkholderia unamae]